MISKDCCKARICVSGWLKQNKECGLHPWMKSRSAKEARKRNSWRTQSSKQMCLHLQSGRPTASFCMPRQGTVILPWNYLGNSLLRLTIPGCNCIVCVPWHRVCLFVHHELAGTQIGRGLSCLQSVTTEIIESRKLIRYCCKQHRMLKQALLHNNKSLSFNIRIGRWNRDRLLFGGRWTIQKRGIRWRGERLSILATDQHSPVIL